MTDSNKEESVSKVCTVKIKDSIKQQLEAFQRGFNLIISQQWLKLFSPSDLQLLISGSSVISVKEMSETASYRGGYDGNSQVIR